jgi:Protein of unknown function (DUF3168)
VSIATFRELLLDDPKTQSFVGDKIGPKDAFVDERPPYITLSVAESQPFNSLQGFTGLNRSEIEVTAWARNYQDAVTIALAARAALEAADPGNVVVREPGDETAFQGDIAVFGHAYIIQTFDSDD